MQLADPEKFLLSVNGKRIVLDEVHRLDNPSELLKLAADYYPNTRIVATGSSSISASSKFRDVLTGRKLEVWLTPMVSCELASFGNTDLIHRMKRGGLPPFFLGEEFDPSLYQEWMDSYWAKDVQGLFPVEKKEAFEKFVELVFLSSSGVFQATKFASRCEINRSTIKSYLRVLGQTRVAHLIRPFSSRRSNEIISAPKVYAFDTGFTAVFRGWNELRAEDMGTLWEHLVLNELQAYIDTRLVRYWRTKKGAELDFVIAPRGRKTVTAIECKWSAKGFSASGLKSFRSIYPDGENLVVCADVVNSFTRSVSGINVEFIGLGEVGEQAARLIG